MDRKQYAELEIRRTLTAVNEFLRAEGASFSIPDPDVERFTFYLDGETAQGSGISETDLTDAYSQGRRVGAIFYRHFNPNVSQSQTLKAEKLRRVVEHAFG